MEEEMKEGSEEKGHNFWVGRRASIEIVKEGRKLIFTCVILDFDSNFITFRDRDNKIFSFNTEFIKQMQLLDGGR